jgi:hypothetical protein
MEEFRERTGLKIISFFIAGVSYNIYIAQNINKLFALLKDCKIG